MSTRIQRIGEAKVAAIRHGLDALESLEARAPVATAGELQEVATTLVLVATQLRACARDLDEAGRANYASPWGRN